MFLVSFPVWLKTFSRSFGRRFRRQLWIVEREHTDVYYVCLRGWSVIDKMKLHIVCGSPMCWRNDPFIIPSEGISKSIEILVVAIVQLMIAVPCGAKR